MAGRNRFPGYIFGNRKPNDAAGSANILQKPNDLIWRHSSTWSTDQGVPRRIWVVEQHRTKFRWVENINIEMNGEMSDPLVCNPIQHRRRSIDQRVYLGAAKSELIDNLTLDRHPGVKPCTHDARWIDWRVDLAHQFGISPA